ncbi:MAG: cell division protein ZapA [Myxococcales bacterium]|nr:cell division protein ZapA [Myxococcales bacterium]
MRRSVAVTIAGQRYMLKSDAEVEYVNSIAAFVDQKIGEVQRSTRQVGTHQVAILAALQIADDLFQERRRRAELRRKVRDRSRRMLATIAREVKA